jgi:hypothetical protein
MKFGFLLGVVVEADTQLEALEKMNKIRMRMAQDHPEIEGEVEVSEGPDELLVDF